MDRNNDFENKKQPPDIDEYVLSEIMQYYGEDVINNINRSSTSAPKKRRISKYRSAIGVICSVLFLVGAIIFSGVVFSLDIPVSGTDSSVSSADTASYVSEQLHSDTETSTNTGTASSDTEYENSVTASTVTSHSDLPQSDTTSLTATSATSSDTESESSVTVSTDLSVESVSEDTDTDHYLGDYSLPETPDAETLTEPQTDINDNESTNPNNIITTGKKVGAGIGIFLMIMSLAVSFMLRKIYVYNEN